MQRLTLDSALRGKMGVEGLRLARERFSSTLVTRLLLEAMGEA